MKRVISLCLIMAIMLSLLQTTLVTAATEEGYNDLGIIFDKSTGTITDADETISGNFTIPESIEGVSVNCIAMGAFAYCSQLSEITVPDSITKIEPYAFYGCTNAHLVANEHSPAIRYAIENDMDFNIVNKITAYEHFADDKTSYGIAKELSSEHLSFKLSYQIKEGKVLANKRLTICIPNDTWLISDTLKLNGITVTDYEYNERILSVPVDSDSGTLTFSVQLAYYGEISTYARMDFVEDEKEKSETIGILNTSSPYITIKAAEKTASTYAQVEGFAPPSSAVEIYLDNQLSETVYADNDGIYYAEIELSNAENYKLYSITAKAVDGETTILADTSVMYVDSNPNLNSLSMRHNNKFYYLSGGYGNSKDIVFDTNGFIFEADFENPESVESVYIVSTKNNQKKYMNAYWNESSQTFVAEGYFEDTETDYMPGEINVEYTKKRPTVPVSDTIDNAAELIEHMNSSVKDCVVNVIENTEDSYVAKIDVAEEIKGLIGDEIDFVVNTLHKEYNDTPIEDLMKSAENYYSYFFEEDGEKYVLNLDLTDPETLNMVVHDISKNKELNYIIDIWGESSAGGSDTALQISDVLGKVGTVTGTLADMYNIESEDADLRDKILSSNMTPEEKKAALKKADELKTDKELFLLTTTIISVATASFIGPPAVAFGLLFGAVTTSSDFFWGKRIANILGTEADSSFNWTTSEYLAKGEFGAYEDNLSYTLTKSGILTITGTGSMGSGSPEWNNYASRIKNVKILGTPTDLMYCAFNNCTNLESIHMPDTIKSLGGAFFNCKSLKSIDLPDNLTKIDSGTFALCESLESIYIPYGVKIIEDSAFLNCTNLKSADLPKSLESIGNYAFQDCKNLKHISIPDSVTKIGDEAFANCESIEKINIPHNINYTSDLYSSDIGTNIFKGCINLKSIVIPAKIIEVADSVFYECQNIITDITATDGDVSIPSDVFCWFPNLETLSIGNGDTTIEPSAFENCYNLKSLKIGNGDVYINNSTFNNCMSLTDIEIGNGSVTIDSEVFAENTSLKNLYLGNGPKTIGTWAFRNCKNLTNVEMGSGDTTIDSAAFINCKNLKKVTIGDGVSNIGSSAFSGCTNLVSADIPKGTENIGDYAFENCTSLTSIDIPDSVTSIGQNAFYNCVNLKGVNISENIETISSGTFKNCSNLTSVYIPASVTNIEMDAFAYCTNLTSVVMSESIATIGISAFANCNKLKEVKYSGTEDDWSMISIGICNEPLLSARGIYNCSSLTNITIFDVIQNGENANVKISAKNVPASATVHIVSYNNDGSVSKITPVTFSDGSVKTSISSAGTETFKAFIWDFNNIKPLCTPGIHIADGQ